MGDRKLTVIDLFAGCGGLSLGLYQSGWRGLFAIEKNECAFKTLEHNLISKLNHFAWPSWLPQTPHDINNLIRDYKKELLSLRGTVDLVAGGPPCQGFSMAGKRMKEDERNQLVFSYIDFIKLVKPRAILFENVKGFTYSFDKTKNPDAIPYSQLVIDKLRELGYDVTPHIINFAEYGIPQRRKRFILVGVRKNNRLKSKEFIELLNTQFLQLVETGELLSSPVISDAISDLQRSNGEGDTVDRPGFKSGKYGHPSSSYQKLMRKTLPPSVTIPNSHSFAKHTLQKIQCFERLLKEFPVKGKRIDKEERGKWGILQRGITILDPTSVSPTITGAPDDYLHYSEPRILTVRECARIQSFPDWFEFKSKYTTGGAMRKKEVPRYSQVGNAIPPLFAYQAGLVLKQMLI